MGRGGLVVILRVVCGGLGRGVVLGRTGGLGLSVGRPNPSPVSPRRVVEVVGFRVGLLVGFGVVGKFVGQFVGLDVVGGHERM